MNVVRADITGVLWEHVPSVWPKVVGLVERAVEESCGEHTSQDIYAGLCLREMQLWIAYRGMGIDGVMVTQIDVHPQKRYLFIVLLAGIDPERWQHGWEIVHKWAVEQGLDGVRTLGRRGFERHPLSAVAGLKRLYTLYGVDFVSRRLQ